MKKLILNFLALNLLICTTVSSQNTWQQAGGPSGAYINQIYAGPDGYAYTVIPDYSNPKPYDGFYRSSDYADSWEFIEVSGGFTWINGIDDNGNIYISVNDTVLRSTDNGESWIPVYTGIFNFGMLLVGNSDTLYVHGSDLLMSVDNGLSWNLTDTTYAYYMVANSAGYLIRATTNNELFISYNNGNSWEEFTEVPFEGDILSMAINQQDEIFIGTYASGIYKIAADGSEWELIPEIFFQVDYIEVTTNETIFIRTYLGIVYVSYDHGETWTGSFEGLMSFTTGGFASADSVVYTVWQEGIYKTVDNGQSWSEATEGIYRATVWSLKASPTGDIYARTDKRLLKSTDHGDSWQTIFGGEMQVDLIDMHILPDSTIYLVTLDLSIDKALVDSCHDYSCTHLYRSTDGGATWVKVLDASSINDMTMSPDGDLYLATETTVWITPDNGLSWEAVYTDSYGFGHLDSDSTGTLYSKGYGGLYKSTDGALTWELVSLPENENIYILLDFKISTSGKMYSLSIIQSGDEFFRILSRSSDAGLTWEEITPAGYTIYDIYTGMYDNLYLSTNTGLLRSTDDGDTYTNISSEETDNYTYSATEDSNGRIYVSLPEQSVYFSDTYVNTQNRFPSNRQVSFYPNPANNKILVTCEDLRKPVDLRIYNIHGQLIMIHWLTSEQTMINLTNLTTGIYTLMVEEQVSKLIITK